MKQNRFESPVLWAAVVAQMLAILVVLGVIDIGQSEAVSAVVAGILQLLVAFGVLNNPTQQDGF
jgi:Bacteriophage holin.